MSCLLKPRKIKKFKIKKVNNPKVKAERQYKELSIDRCKKVTCPRGYSFDRRISYKLTYGDMFMIHEIKGME